MPLFDVKTNVNIADDFPETTTKMLAKQLEKDEKFSLKAVHTKGTTIVQRQFS